MSKVNDGGPAFPSNRDMRYGGMTLRQYAAIKLRVPNSGTDWLDEMIRTSLRDDLAAKAMQGYLSSSWQAKELDSLGKSSCEQMAIVAEISYAMADATIKARGASLMPVNPNEAPPGFVAVEDDDANACEYCHVGYGTRLCMKQYCEGSDRDDGCNVRYSLKPAAIWPYDSEGTPI